MRLTNFFTLTIFCFCFSQFVRTQNIDQLDSLASALTNKFQVKGMVMICVKNDEFVFKKAYGKANETHAMTPETPVYIASNTKAFIGLAMAQLIENGQVSLDDPLIKYIDRNYFPKDLEIEQVTVRDLLSHATGLSNDPLTFRTSSSGEYPENLQELLKFTTYRGDATTLIKEFNYSNFGYLLAGMVIEKIANQPWKNHLADKVLKPLNMSSTEAYLPKGKDRDAMAIPYIFNREEPLKLVKKDNTLHAAGGLVSNLDDMAKWLIYHTGNSDASLAFKTNHEAYLSPTIKVDESFGPIKVTGYGYGWYHGDFFGTPIIFHPGGFSGHNSFMSYLPNEKIGCFFYLNEITNLRLIALQLTFYYYALFSDNDYFMKSMGVFAERIQSVYDNYQSDKLIPIDPKSRTIPLGTFRNDQYGTLNIKKDGNEYLVALGENLQSIAYQTEQDSQFLVQFIPESNVIFSIIENKEGTKIKYGEYGFFYPFHE